MQKNILSSSCYLCLFLKRVHKIKLGVHGRWSEDIIFGSWILVPFCNPFVMQKHRLKICVNIEILIKLWNSTKMLVSQAAVSYDGLNRQLIQNESLFLICQNFNKSFWPHQVSMKDGSPKSYKRILVLLNIGIVLMIMSIVTSRKDEIFK